MSFSREVKDETARAAINDDCCKIAETAAFFRAAGKLILGGNNLVGISVVSGNASVVRRYYSLIKQLSSCEADIVVSKSTRLKKNNRYELRVAPQLTVVQLLILLGIWKDDGYVVRDNSLKNFAKKNCCRKAILRGFFLGAGSLSSPKGDYHLELNIPSAEAKSIIARCLKVFEISAGIIERKENLIMYIKEAEAIIDFLRIVGAHNSVLHYENARVVKDMRNRINREVNCETANLQKTVRTAGRQIEKIRLITDLRGLEWLPTALKITAQARLDNPEASIGELVEIINDGTSKSGINHRLRKLEQIADNLI
ncbi:MAG: DNA-binding protein WhiA [Negativicutes bacterium]|jgi:hypothetical protein